MARRVYVREIYFYIVCLIALILFIIGLVTINDNAFNYVKPAVYTSREVVLPAYREQYTDLSQEEIDTLIEEEILNAINNEKTFALKGLLRGRIFIVISVPLFIYHWRKAQVMWRMSGEN